MRSFLFDAEAPPLRSSGVSPHNSQCWPFLKRYTRVAIKIAVEIPAQSALSPTDRSKALSLPIDSPIQWKEAQGLSSDTTPEMYYIEKCEGMVDPPVSPMPRFQD